MKDTENKAFNELTEAEKRALIDARFQQEAIFSVPRERSDSIEELKNKVFGDLALAESLTPQDNLERMLIGQMIATHRTAMGCLSHAAQPERRAEQREADLKQATRLMSIFA